MKTLKSFFTALALIMPLFSFAQSDLAGNWKTMGKWEDGSDLPILVSIAADGSYTVDFGIDGNIDVKGFYETKGDQLTIVEKEGQAVECRDVKGIYRFTVDATALVMTVVEDTCAGRSGSGKMEFTRQ